MYGLDTIYVLLQMVHSSNPGKFVLLVEAGNGVFFRMIQAAQGIRVSMLGSLGNSDSY